MSLHSKKFTIRLPVDLLQLIDEAAMAGFETRSDYIREAIVLRLNNQQIVQKVKPQTDEYSWESFSKRLV